MEALEYSAKNLNAHFHAICRGNIPLSMDWNEEAQKAAEVDDQSLEFLKRLKSLVQSRGKLLSATCRKSPDPQWQLWSLARKPRVLQVVR